MVVQKTLDNLKDRPHDEKKVVAGGIAITVVLILFVGWGFLFLRKIQRNDIIPHLQGGAVPTDQFDAALLRGADQGTQNNYKQTPDSSGSGGSVDAPVGSTPDSSQGAFGGSQ